MLGEKTGVCRQHPYKWFNGMHSPRGARIQLIAMVLSLRLGVLISEADLLNADLTEGEIQSKPKLARSDIDQIEQRRQELLDDKSKRRRKRRE